MKLISQFHASTVASSVADELLAVAVGKERVTEVEMIGKVRLLMAKR